MNKQSSLKALALTCSLKPSPAKSSTDLLASQVLDELKKYDVETELIRVVDFDIKPGVAIDMGDGDEWPAIQQKIMQADILLVATPTWAGHMSSVASRVVERLDAELSNTDDEGRLKTYGKAGIVAVVGNEDGAHKICADLFQALNDFGFTIPASGATYWNGEAMHRVDYNDLDKTPKVVKETTGQLASNAVHLARLLKASNYSARK